MTCACGTTPDDGCGCCCCEDGAAADAGVAPTPAAAAPIVARTGEPLYPVQPTPKETKNRGELLVAVTAKPAPVLDPNSDDPNMPCARIPLLMQHLYALLRERSVHAKLLDAR